eukprot:4528795-Heterocapsa_arctica.AAC.1
MRALLLGSDGAVLPRSASVLPYPDCWRATAASGQPGSQFALPAPSASLLASPSPGPHCWPLPPLSPLGLAH